MNKFSVKFRGVRGSYPKAKQNFLKYGGNTSCVEVQCGKQLIILDAGTGIIDIGQDVIQNSIINQDKSPHNALILISHIHQDHIQGLQFYKPLFNPTSKINLFGYSTKEEENLKDSLKTILFDKVFPLSLDEIKSNFKINNFTEDNVIILSQNGAVKLFNIYDEITINEDDVVISAHKTTAHPKYGCLCIKIQYKTKTLIYATDKESYIGSDKRFIQFAHNCDMLIHDAQYTYQDYISPIHPKQGFGHSTFEMAVETALLSKAKKLFFFHYDPDYDDVKLEMLEEQFKNDTTFFAKENLEIEL